MESTTKASVHVWLCVFSSLTLRSPCAAAHASWGAAFSPGRPCGRCSLCTPPGWRQRRCPGWLRWTGLHAPACTESPHCVPPAERSPEGCTCTKETPHFIRYPTSTPVASSSSFLTGSSPLFSVLHVIRKGIVAQQQFHSVQVAIVTRPMESGPPLCTRKKSTRSKYNSVSKLGVAHM